MPSQRSCKNETDEGFTLVEVVVALGILMVVMSAVLPQIIVGIRGAAVADSMTAAKGIVEAQMEKMRNLPWHVAPSAELRIDVLDRYFPNLTAPSNTSFACLEADGSVRAPATTRTGYVSGTTRCAYEPSNGPFYRTVELVDPAGPAVYTLVTDTQFLTSVAPATTPADYAPVPAGIPTTGYDSSDNTKDDPISPQIGVTITAFDTRAGRQLKPMTAYTQIADDLRSLERITAVADATAIQISGVTRGDQSVSVSAGQVDLSGFLARLSTASATLGAVSARWSTDAPKGWSVGPVSTPQTTPQLADSKLAGSLTGTCDFVCWDIPSTSAVSVKATGGLPIVSSSSVTSGNPVQAALTGASSSSSSLSFSNTAAADRTLYYRKMTTDLGLDPAQPIVSVAGGSASISECAGGGSGSILGRGFVTSAASTVAACAETGTSVVSVFPRPGVGSSPVLKLTLISSMANCSVTPTSTVRTAEAKYKVKVEAYNSTGAKVVDQEFTQASADSTLQGLLNTQVAPGPVKLSNYVKTWSLGTNTTPTTASTPKTTASASLAGALTLVTQPVRTFEPFTTETATYTQDESSSISVALGAANCLTKDAR